MKKIKSVKELREAINKGNHEFFISLANGFIRSSKNIDFDDSTDKNGEYRFNILNEIDDTEQILSEKQLFTVASNIGKAIKQEAFYMY